MNKEFLSLYEKRPFTKNICGLPTLGHYCLWTILKEIMPKTIIESGIMRGATTWLIENTCPDAELICIDPRPELIPIKSDCSVARPIDNGWFYHISKKAKYQTKDFCLDNFSQITNKADAFVYFDDHMDVLPRLEHCKKFGIQNILFDDNYHSTGGSDHRSLYMLQNCKIGEKIKINPGIPHIEDENTINRFKKINIIEERHLHDLLDIKDFETYTDETYGCSAERDMVFIKIETV